MYKFVYGFLLVIVLGSSGCSDWLDVQPKTSVPEEDLFADEFGFQDALTGFYLKMGESSLYGRELTYNYMEMLAGRYEYAPDITNWTSIYNYDGTYKSIKDNVFSGAYNIIANINNFLYYLEVNREVITTPGYYEIRKGEALGLRAFLHFDLLRMFGPVFAMEPQGKAIPYRTVFSNEPTPVLPATEVVDACLADLHQADSLLWEADHDIFVHDVNADPFLELRQFRMNRWAVKAMLARVYCYKGDEESKAKAYAVASEVVESKLFPLTEALTTENRILFDEHIFSLHIYEMEKVVDPDFIYQNVSGLGVGKELFGQFYDLSAGGSTDFRSGNAAFHEMLITDDTKKILSKYDQTGYASDHLPNYTGAYSGADVMPLIRIPEMYYIMAECDPDPQSSAEILDMVRFKRGIASSDATDGGKGYDEPDTREGFDSGHTRRINEVMREYLKEYYGEGQLFYFYKRHNYVTFANCSLVDVRTKYQFPLPENEDMFGITGK